MPYAIIFGLVLLGWLIYLVWTWLKDKKTLDEEDELDRQLDEAINELSNKLRELADLLEEDYRDSPNVLKVLDDLREDAKELQKQK